jgi:hypothetical protein
MKPQEPYLDSNEAMLNIIVDEITGLKEITQDLQKGLEQRNKVTINLNNELCDKIESLEKELQNKSIHLTQSQTHPKTHCPRGEFQVLVQPGSQGERGQLPLHLHEQAKQGEFRGRASGGPPFTPY